MKTRNMIVAMTMAFVAMFGYAGDSAPFVLDNAKSPSGESVVLPWNAEWIGGNANATVVITDNGTEVKRSTGVGEFEYTLFGDGRHELTYITYVDDVLQDEKYRTVVFKGAYIVHFDANGGDGEMDDCEFAVEKPSILPKGLFTKDGHYLLGWALTPDCEATLLDGDSTADIVADEGETVTLYAVWREDVGVGVGVGENLVLNGDFEAAGYTGSYIEYCGPAYLIDWIPDNAGVCTPKGTYLSSAISAVNNSAWVFLKFASSISQVIPVPSPGSYRLEFDFCGRPSYLNSANVAVSLGGIAVTNIVKDGGSDNGSKVVHYSFDLPITSGGEYLLKFEQTTTSDCSPALDNISIRRILPPSYAVLFDANRGVGSMPKRVYAGGDDVVLPDGVFTRDGWTLVGWATEPEGPAIYASQGVIDGGIVAASGQTVTLYARWAQCQYAIHFDPNGGEGAMPEESLWLGIPDWLSSNEFSRLGYTFAGWSASPNGEVEYADKAIVANLAETANAIVNLYAVWTPHLYWVRFNQGDGMGGMSDQQLTYDVVASLTSNAFTKVGYTFAGWATEADGAKIYDDSGEVLNLASDENSVVDLYATWTPSEYEVTFDALDGVVDGGGGHAGRVTLPVTYDSEYGELPTASCDGYVFLGWLLDGVVVDSNTVVKTATNHTLTAKWAVEIGGGTIELVIDEDSATLVTLITPPLGDVVIPSEVMGRAVVGIGDDVFAGCSGLTSVTIPSSVTRIGDSAFRDCSGITNVAIGEGVESIGANAFVGCTSVTNVTIAGDKFICGDSVAGFYEAEFLNMNSLDGLVSIVDNARATTQSAAMLYASDIGTYRMYAYGAYMHFEGGITYHFSADYDDYSFVKIDDTMIISPSSSQCAKQTGSISFAESGWHWLELRGHNYGGRGALNNGNEEGFWWWTSADATNRKFEDPGDGSLFRTSMSSTMSGLFPDSYAQIKRVSLVGDWESIPEGFYAGCSSLESVKIPGSVTNIGANAFEGCPDSIYDVTTISGVKLVDGWVVGYTDSLSGSLNLSEVIGIADGAFKNCSFAFSVILPSNVERISDGEFSGCSGLTGVTIGDCVWDIGEGAFAGCTSLRRVEAAIGLKRLLEKNGVFADCSDDLEIVYHRTAEICNVVARQRKPWNGKVDITFELEGNVAAGFPTNVYPVIVVSAADRVNGTNYVAVADALSGDTRTAEGVHHVIWDLNAQGLEFKSDEVVFSVEYGAPVNKYCVIDLSAGANATSYPVSYLYLADEPTDGWTDEYKTTKLVLRRIEPGTFTMGSSDVSDNPPHQVTLTQPFYMGVFQVTQKQYELVVGNNPAAYKGDMRPVEQVSWAIVRGDALVYDWPSSTSVNPDSFVGRIQARTGLNFDLPTEAQWEYACRAGTTSRYNNGGDSEDDLKLLGRYSGNQSDGNGGCSQHTTVGSYQSNAWGLYDMHGNVWEWCLDWYDYLNLDVLIDPVGPMTPRDWGDPSRVFRGGAYNMPANMSYSAHRAAYRNTRVSHLTGDFGFRLARTMSEAENTAMVGAGQEEPLCYADSTAVEIDSRVEPIVDSVVVSWDASWIGGDAGAKVVIADNGVEIGRKTGLGEFEYMLDGDCRHNLTYTTLIDDVEQTEVYAAKVFKDWKYEVADDAAIMTGTAQTSGTLVIPSEIDGYPVTGIGDGAFAGCGGLTGVTIPDGFIVIGDGAFAGCSNIHAVSLGAQCVAACPGLMQAKFNTRFDLSSMLEDAESADRVSGVIAAYTKVTSAPWEFSDPLTGEVYAWNDSYSTMAYFGQMYLVGGKTYVFGAHFDDDAYVKVAGKVLISRQSPSGNSFYMGACSCRKSGWYDVEFRLSDATGGKGSWGNIWSSDFGLGYRDDGNTSWNQSGWKRLLDVGDGTLFRTVLGVTMSSLFPDSYDKIRSVTLTGEAEEIGDSAFAGCKVLESADIPSTVTSIGDNAFRDCASLTSITIPESVMSIGDGVFEGCSRLTSVTMPYRFKAQFGDTLNGCPITYIATVRFVADGSEIPTRFVVYGSAVGELTEFVSPTGYSFGWFTAQDGGAQFWADTVVTEDVTLYARWVANEYEVTFDAAGGEVDGGDGHAGRVTLPMTYDSAYGVLPTATRVGYTFDGWMLGDTVVTSNTVVKTAEDHTLVARWIVNEYQVTFNAAGGVVGTGSKAVTYDGVYGELPTASCDGYVFIGWMLDGVDVGADTVVKTANDHTVKAKWGIQIGNGIWSVSVNNRPITLGAPLVPPSGEVAIPATIAGRPVVGITAEAFAGNAAVTGVTVPASVDVEVGAMGNIPVSVVVNDDGQYIADAIAANVRKVVFANGVTRIPDNYFRIGEDGHAGRVTLPNLETFDIAESVVRIGTNVFEAASALETETIGGFVVCDGWVLRPNQSGGHAGRVTLPEGVRGIASGAFEGAYDIETVEFPSTLRFIGAGAFRDCTGIEDIALPEGVVAVDRDAFRNCTYAQTLSLPTTLVEIGGGAFANGTSLSGVEVPDGVVDIGECAFSNCWRMMAVSIPASVTNVGVDAFADCRRLAGVTVPFGVGTMAELFSAAYDKIASVVVTDGGRGATALPMQAGMFAGCAAMESLVLPKGLGEIADEAFVGCESMAAFDFPVSVTNIGARVFKDLTQLTSIVIPVGVTSLGAEVFSGCSSLSAVALPKGLTVLPDGAFEGCSSLTEIVVPEDVASVGAGVFNGCTLLRSVRFVGNHAPACAAGSYSGSDAALVTYVARGSMGWDGIPTSKSLPEFWPDGTAHEITWWEPNRFDVAFVSSDADGGAATSVVEQVTGTTYMLPSDPTLRGATFGGWWTAMDGGARVTPVTQVALTRPHTFFAHWTYNRYAVIFDANGGEGNMAAVDMTVATSAALPECGFARTGYVFLGWATEPEGGVVYSDAAEVVDLAYEQGAAVTLYAVWEERVWTVGAAMCEGDVLCKGIRAVESADWTVDLLNGHEANSPSARSGAIGAAEDAGRTNSTLSVTVTGEGAGSFWWKVSCEEMDDEYGEWYDYAVFSVDGVVVARIAGDSGWQQVEYTVTGTGNHVLAWTFTRDDYDEPGAAWENAAWVDDLVWTPVPKVLTLGDVICDGEGYVAATTGGDADWGIDTTAGYADGNSAKSGAVASGQSSWIEVAVSGAGTATFRWNVQGGAYRGTPFAYAKVEVDGVQKAQEYSTGGWKEQTVEVEGTGSHTIRWTYLRTSSRAADGDCAWLDCFAWTPCSDIPVDMGGGKSVVVPQTWIEEYPDLVAAAGGDASAALQAKSANGRMSVVECYVVGVDPEKADEDFKIVSFQMNADGTPDLASIVFEPARDNWNVPAAQPVVKGAAELGGEWQTVTEQNKAGMRFFRVEVSLP